MRRPEHVAVVDGDGTVTTYGEMGARVNQLSRAMLRMGLRNRDRLALVVPNRRAHLEVILAAAQIGVDQVPVNVHLTAAELAYILADCEPRAVVVDRSTEMAVNQAVAGLDVPVLSVEPGVRVSICDLAADEVTDPLDHRTGGGIMVYTSGTSGRPKGVRRDRVDALPEAGIVPGLTYLLKRFGINTDYEVGNGVYLALCPLYHGAPGGYARLALHLGHTVILPARFNARAALGLIKDYKVTWLNVVPTMFKRLLDLPAEIRQDSDLSSLRWALHAGAPCPPAVKRQMIDWWGPIIYEFYASTEAGGTCIGSEEWLAHAPSVGRAWPGADIRILDDRGDDRAPGEVGRVFFLDTRPFEYNKDPSQTQSARSSDGKYVTTGDLGYLDLDGYLYLVSRRTDLIISGGVNIYPAEIEAALLECAAVADVGVFGVEDPEWGQSIVAVVETKDAVADQEAVVQLLRDHCEQRLASFKRPRRYIFSNDVARSEAGKIQRHLLIERYGSHAAAE